MHTNMHSYKHAKTPPCRCRYPLPSMNTGPSIAGMPMSPSSVLHATLVAGTPIDPQQVRATTPSPSHFSIPDSALSLDGPARGGVGPPLPRRCVCLSTRTPCAPQQGRAPSLLLTERSSPPPSCTTSLVAGCWAGRREAEAWASLPQLGCR